MKLYLSSSGMPNSDKMTKLIGKTDGIKVASIKQAWEPYSQWRQGKWSQGVEAMFSTINATTEDLDLKLYEGEGENLLNKLSNYDLIWAHGGNTFTLNYWAAKSGFHDVIKTLLNKGVVYGGDSAGAILATPTLRSVELEDDIKAAPEPVWDAMGLVNFGIIPHWTGSSNDLRFYEELKKHIDRVVTLRDGDFIIVDGDHIAKY